MTYNPYFDGHRGGQQPEPSPDEWQIDERTGKRFRKIGNCIEYEMEYGNVPASVFFASQKKQKEADEERRKREAAEQEAARTGRTCPFKVGQNSIKTSCEKSCAFYVDTACILARMDSPATRDTKNMDCIIARKCNETCAMYNHGCTLIETVKGMKPGKE